MCRALVRDEARAEELAQDVFVRAFGALDGFRGEASSRTWILASARNRCMDALRRGQLDEPDEDVEHTGDDAPLPPELCENRAEVLRALHVLPEISRALVVLKYVHGFGYAELAETFGIKAGTARMRVSRALAQMRAELQPEPALASLSLDLDLEEACLDEMPAESAAPMPAAAPAPAAPMAKRSRRAGFGGGLSRSAPAGPPQAPPTDFASALGSSSRGLAARLLGIARSL